MPIKPSGCCGRFWPLRHYGTWLEAETLSFITGSGSAALPEVGYPLLRYFINAATARTRTSTSKRPIRPILDRQPQRRILVQ
jgi:hypothetical protein